MYECDTKNRRYTENGTRAHIEDWISLAMAMANDNGTKSTWQTPTYASETALP